jgi:hypothetical protein
MPFRSGLRAYGPSWSAEVNFTFFATLGSNFHQSLADNLSPFYGACPTLSILGAFMNLFRQFPSSAIVAALLLSAACDSPNDATETVTTDEYGSLSLTVGQAPPDARCLRIMLAGSTAAQRSSDLVSGQSSTLLFSGLPIGNVAISAQAFAVTCANVLAETPASWVTPNAVSVLIRPAATTQVALELQRSGGIAISVSFVEPGDGGVTDGAQPLPTTDGGAPKFDASLPPPPPSPDAATGDGSIPPPPVADGGFPNSDGGAPSADGGIPSTPGIQVSLTSSANTTESGAQATFTIRLLSAPTANTIIGLSSSDNTEGSVSPTAVQFGPANWSSPQIVTVTGVDDDFADGNQPFQIVTNAAVSADPKYNGLNALDVALVNMDNDVAGIFVMTPTTSTTTESGSTGTFTVRLSSKPQANVLIGLSSSDTTEGTVTPASLTFTAADWNAPKVVTFAGVDDAIVDGNQPYSIVTAPAQSADLAFNGVNAPDVSLVNLDDDIGQPRTALVVVGAIPLSAGDQALVNRLSNNLGFTVNTVLAAQMTTASATGYALVAVSETVSSADVGTKLTTLTSPILNGEPAIQDELGMTGAAFGTQQGTDATQTTLVITNAASPLAAGLSGTVSIASSPSPFAWGQPAAQATVISQASSGANKSSVYTYATGATMFSGTAAGPRAMFPATGAAAAALNANGWALFDALAKWLVPSPLKASGAACTIGSQCLSGSCVNGFCN